MLFMISWKVRQMMKYDLTLAKIRNTDFASLYDRFIVGEKLSQKQNYFICAEVFQES